LPSNDNEFCPREQTEVTTLGPYGIDTNLDTGATSFTVSSDLANIVDQLEQILTDAYVPEASREDMAGAIADVLDVLAGNGGEEEDDLDSDDSDD
jgi:hypothetical protein